MTKLLIKIFIKEYQKTDDLFVRSAYGKLAGWVGIICNLLLFLGKCLIGAAAGSVAVVADAINSLSDASANVISLLGFKMASKPADKDHPYGHARYEYLAGLFVALLVMAIGLELLKTGIQRVLEPVTVDFTLVTVGILLGSILVKLWLAVFYRSVGKRISSQTLLAAAVDSRNDVISTAAVLIAGILAYKTGWMLDGWLGIAVALFILYSGFDLVKETLDSLLGKAPDPELVKRIHDKVLSYEGVLGTHDLMIHDYGPGRLFASVHVEMAAEADVIRCHAIIDRIEEDFLEQDGLNMLIHFDPIITDSAVEDIRSWLNRLVKSIDERISIHDLRQIIKENGSRLIFDCVVPYDYPVSDTDLKERIQELVSEEHSDSQCLITIDRSYAPLPHSREQES